MKSRDSGTLFHSEETPFGESAAVYILAAFLGNLLPARSGNGQSVQGRKVKTMLGAFRERPPVVFGRVGLCSWTCGCLSVDFPTLLLANCQLT
jgi:hypothetical protein